MGWESCVILLRLVAAALGLGLWVHPAWGLQHSYDCGVQGMQLLVVPRPGQTIRFKVLDEFGNRFEVENCSICYHWVTSEPQGPAVLSAYYKGCHVLEKDGRSHLRVLIEALLPDGHVAVGQEVTLICPKPDNTWTLDSHPSPPSTPSPAPQTLPFRLASSHAPPGSGQASSTPSAPEYSLAHPTPASPSWGPAPTSSAPTLPQVGTMKRWDVDKPDYVGTHLPQEQCRVASGHIPCTVGSSSKEACQQAGCCYDNTREVPCYYGNTATVQCFRSGYFMLVLSQETALAHRITLANVRLAYAPAHCPPTQATGAFVVFRVPLTHCGTTIQMAGNQLIYENQLVSDIDVRKGTRGSITRDGTFRLHVRCTFNAGDFLPIQASIFPPPSPAPVTQAGPLRLELRIAKDETFGSYYSEGDYPLLRLLREPLHVEVRLLRRTDPSLVLVLHQCWATPSANPFRQPQWPILSEGCPFEGDSYRTQLVTLDRPESPFQSHFRRFTIATFALLNSSSQTALRGPVFFFCSASACYPSRLEPCSPACGSGTARQRRSSGHQNGTTRPLDIVSSPGPVAFQDFYELGPIGSSRNSVPRPLLWVVLLLLAVALVLGVGIFVGLRQTWVQKHREGLSQ